MVDGGGEVSLVGFWLGWIGPFAELGNLGQRPVLGRRAESWTQCGMC